MHIRIEPYRDSELLYLGNSWNSNDIRRNILSVELGMVLLTVSIHSLLKPSSSKMGWAISGQDKYVVGKINQISSIDHISKLLRGT